MHLRIIAQISKVILEIQPEKGIEKPAAEAAGLAPPVGLEPTTHGLTVRRSTD